MALPRPRRARATLAAAAAALAAAAVAALASCGTDAVGVETCRRVETARCNRAPGCGLSLENPIHTGDDVTACTLFYRDACLHGLVSKNDPGAVAVDACIKAISSGTCDIVEKPADHPACAFLIPNGNPDAGPDAATDAAPAVPTAPTPSPSSSALPPVDAGSAAQPDATADAMTDASH